MASLGHGFQCLSVCALLFACSKSVLFAAARVEDVTSRQHILVHITDPQPGMLNMYTHPEDWAAEETMFSRLVAKAAGLRPSLVFVGGDMQNWWPNENSSADRNRPRKDMPDEDFEELKRKDLGKLQRNAARRSVQTLVSAGIPVVYTAGNHDVGDFPDESTLAQYTSSDSENPGWGPLFQKVKKEDGVLYLQFNSQIYWSTEASMETHRSQQLEFLQEEMSNIGDVRQLVLLTHIPPFMDSVDEEEGWANWKEHYRKEVLDVLAAPKIPMLWICGHFHANVVKDSSYQGVPLSIRVTSAAGTTMQWDGKDEMTPHEAETVASKAIMKAFAEDIGFANIPERLKAESDRSGLRIFKISADGFEDQWFTLDDLDSSRQTREHLPS